MIPPKKCPNCKFFKKKEHLGINNKIVIKEYCLKFNQELSSHHTCPKFHYTDNVEVDTIYGKIAFFSGMLVSASFIVAIVAFVVNSTLVLGISGTIAFLSLILFAIFVTVDGKIEKKVLYGDN
jgi:hypothetical protein